MKHSVCRIQTLLVSLTFMAGIAMSSQIAIASQRVALVIGNSDYESLPLTNPVHDATDIANLLEKLDFEVIKQINADHRTMRESMDLFYKRLKKAEVGLFYFAGHGMQIDGINYLIPLGAQAENPQSVKYEAVQARRILGIMEDAGNKLNVVILDACRNNPFRSYFRSSSKGLASMDAPDGTLVAYATAPGAVAFDGKGRNGIYTKHLLMNLKRPGMSIWEVFNQAGLGVRSETGGKQVPWMTSSPMAAYYFAGKGKKNLESNTAATQEPEVAVASQRDFSTAVFLTIGATLVLLCVAGIFLYIRPRLQSSRIEALEQPLAEDRGAGESKAAASPPAAAEQEPIEETDERVKPVDGLSLAQANRTILMAPGPLQGIGRGPRWVFSIVDPHISRQPHGWLSFSDQKLVLTTDGGAITVEGEEHPVLELVQGSTFMLGQKTSFTVTRFIRDRLAVLEVTAGPQTGKVLVMHTGKTPFADILRQPDCAGSLEWHEGRPLVSWAPEALPILPHHQGGVSAQLNDGATLHLIGEEWQVSTLQCSLN